MTSAHCARVCRPRGKTGGHGDSDEEDYASFLGHVRGCGSGGGERLRAARVCFWGAAALGAVGAGGALVFVDER